MEVQDDRDLLTRDTNPILDLSRLLRDRDSYREARIGKERICYEIEGQLTVHAQSRQV